MSDALALNCDQSIATLTQPDEGRQVVLDVVALPTADAAPIALQTSADRSADRSLRLSAKSGLLVRGDATFALVVPASHNERFAFGWGSPPQITRRLDVTACGTGDEWLAFAGGFWGADIGCMPVNVLIGESEATVMIGFGAPCPGQQAPPEPTDT